MQTRCKKENTIAYLEHRQQRQNAFKNTESTKKADFQRQLFITMAQNNQPDGLIIVHCIKYIIFAPSNF